MKVRGEIWKAKSVNGEKVSEGESVEIVRRETLHNNFYFIMLSPLMTSTFIELSPFWRNNMLLSS